LFTSESKKVKLQISETETEEFEIPANAFAHRFLGHTLVVYHNPEQKDTFGPNKVEASRYVVTTERGTEIKVEATDIKGALAHRIRDREIKKIDIFLN
ncbi:MAG: hypothetical protein ABR596_07790, partial [Halarsenatibacteraceae bacterium]